MATSCSTFTYAHMIVEDLLMNHGEFSTRSSLLWKTGAEANSPIMNHLSNPPYLTSITLRYIFRYNMMSSVAKNIYALRAYKPVAAKVYEKGSLVCYIIRIQAS